VTTGLWTVKRLRVSREALYIINDYNYYYYYKETISNRLDGGGRPPGASCLIILVSSLLCVVLFMTFEARTKVWSWVPE